jgi:F-type H+-transporting ATPase subunit epsilon
MEQERFQVKIFSPFEVYYEGEAYSLSAINSQGPFDVLPEHANFISLVNSGPVSIDTPFGKRKFNLERGILRIRAGQATLFANV